MFSTASAKTAKPREGGAVDPFLLPTPLYHHIAESDADRFGMHFDDVSKKVVVL